MEEVKHLNQSPTTDYEKNKFFELTDPNKGYICSYTYRETEGTTELIYFEYMEKGEDLEAPLNKESCNRLKELIENN